MNIITDAIKKAFEKQGYTGDKSAKDIQIVMRLFYPSTGLEWFVYEDLGGGLYMAFANLNDSQCAELGTIFLPEMEATKVGGMLSIERDTSVEPFSLNLQETIDKIKGR